MKGKRSVSRRSAALLGTLAVLLLGAASFASPAGAVLVRLSKHQVAGVTLVRGANPASVPGSYYKPVSAFSTNGNLDYHGGPVLHGIRPYLIFWDPSGEITSAQKALYERWFTDLAADSGKPTNVYAVDQQFTDSTGYAKYDQSFSDSNAITDTQAYPASGCTENAGYTENACLTDAQLQAEVQRLITADGLPDGLTGQAPEYFMVTPPDVNTCFDSSGTQCSDNYYCAYHSSFTDSAGHQALYANLATVLDANDPKSCQFDGNTDVQSPNGQELADVNLKAMSHEMSETITDPLGNAYWDSNSGNEDGDNCNFYGSFDPQGGSNPNAFTPYLGGSATGSPDGTLYNQVINGNPYYIQSEWSNGNVNCEMQPAPATLSSSFTAPATAPVGSAVTLNPSASTSSAGFTSTTWDFGDGTSKFTATGPSSLTHTYSAVGTYTVTLTTVDSYGNVSTISHAVKVQGVPAARIAVTTTKPVSGAPVAFSGASSTDTGSSLTGYAWSFGDGSSGSGASVSHKYKKAGTYTASLTVTDASGATSTTTAQVVVAKAATIASVKVKKGSKVETLKIKLTGAGKLKAGKKVFHVKKARTVTYKLKLSKSQISKIKHGHKVKISVKLTFTPTVGGVTKKTVRFTVK